MSGDRPPEPDPRRGDPSASHGEGPLASHGDAGPDSPHRDDGPDAPHRDAGPDSPHRGDPLAPHRDDGPLGLLGRPRGGRGVLLPEVVVLTLAVLVALVPPIVAAVGGAAGAADGAAGGVGGGWAAGAGAPGWVWVALGLVLAVLARVGRRLARLDWPVPALLRALEYGGVLVLTGGGPASYALLAVLAFRHYDTVYRVRTLGVPPPRWLAMVTGGWPLRLAVLVVAAALEVTGPVVVALTVVLAVLVVPESLACWLAEHRGRRR